MAENRDIMDLREATKELRASVDHIKEKFSNDVNSAFGISRDLHQKQALIIAKVEVRLEAIENLSKQALLILQGDGNRKGVVGRIDVLEQNVKNVEGTNRAQEDSIQALLQNGPPCELHNTRITRNEEDLKTSKDSLSKVEVVADTLKGKEAQYRGGWVAVGVVLSFLCGSIAIIIQIYKFLNP